MINIVCTHLDTGEVESCKVKNLSDITLKAVPVVNIPSPETLDVDDSLNYNFLPVNLFNKTEFSVSIFVPYDDGNDFFYQYLDNSAWNYVSEDNDYKKNCLGCKFSDIFKNMEDLKVLDILKSVYADGKRRGIQLAVYQERDLLIYLEFSFVKYGNKLYGFSERKTDKVLTAKELEKVLSEKDQLLKELQDRVRNNLQLIRSFIDIELCYHPDSPKDNLKKTRNRITTMAIVHQEIYNSQNPFSLNNCNFIENALSSLFSAYECTNISLNFDFDSQISIDMDHAIILGLIINELAVNTIDFAFPNNESGMFHIGIHKDDLGVVNVEIFDNGVGLPEGMKMDLSENLGFTIVKSLVGQLDGTFEELDLNQGFGLLIKY